MAGSGLPAAILTYHRIVPDGEQSAFHDLCWSPFAAQMETLAVRVTGISDGMIELAGGRRACLTFDDGTEDHWSVGCRLHRLGLPATFFVVAGRLGESGRLTREQVAELAAQGHRIASHTMTHRRLTGLAPKELRFELRRSKEVLEDISGRPVDWLAPPGGYFSEPGHEQARDAGYAVIRGMEWGYATAPLDGWVPALPILGDYGVAGFTAAIEGRAPLWRYRLKQGLKRVLGETVYLRVRDRLQPGPA